MRPKAWPPRRALCRIRPSPAAWRRSSGFYVQDGALLAYGFSAADQFKRAAVYASRIQKGEKAGDLPVQGPSLFEFGINLKTAKAMGLTVPQSLLIAADEIVQ